MSSSASAAVTLPFNILTDLPSQSEMHKQVRQLCSKIPALDAIFEIIDKRQLVTKKGADIRLGFRDITTAQAELFAYLMLSLKPILSIEMGFEKGIVSALLTALHMHNGLNGGHIPIQNAAKIIHGGSGYKLLEELNLQGYQIMEHETSWVLPQIFMQQLNEGLSFVYFNSARTFDEQMMEYYYISRLLNEGGVMAVNTRDDARRELVEYVRKTHQDWAIREIDENLTLIQMPMLSVLAQHSPEFRH